MSLHSISAGDVVRAFRLLDARDEDTRAAIARVLGFDLQAEARPLLLGRRTRNDEKPSPHTSFGGAVVQSSMDAGHDLHHGQNSHPQRTTGNRGPGGRRCGTATDALTGSLHFGNGQRS